MQRSSLALLLVIALLTGFAVRSILFRSTPTVESTSDAAAKETAQAFYDDLNNALGGAPIDPLAAQLSPIFVDHISDTGATRPADGFLNEVGAMSASSPRLRLKVRSIESAGGNVVAAIHFVQDGGIEVAGMSVEQLTAGPHYEVIRVERGKIVDRWAPEFRWLDASESEDAPLSISSFSGIVTSLMRVELTDSIEHEWRTVGIGTVMVESGSAILQISHGNGTDAPVVLERGSFASIPNGVRARLRSADGNPVSIAIYVAAKIGPSSASLPVGDLDGGAPAASLKVLWTAPHYWSQSATVHRPAQIVLPVGGAIELTRPPGADLLLAGDAGVIQVGIAGGSVAVLGEDRWPVTSESVVQIDASHAASISGDGTVFVRNMSDAPVTLVLISIEKAPIPGEQDDCPEGTVERIQESGAGR